MYLYCVGLYDHTFLTQSVGISLERRYFEIKVGD